MVRHPFPPAIAAASTATTNPRACLGIPRGPLCCQRRDQSGLEKLMQDRSDPYLLPIQELDIPRIAAIALEEGKELQHLWDGLTALNATLRMQVEDGAATKEDLDAALRLYAEVMRHAPTTIAAAAGAEGAGSGGDAIPKSLSEDEWRREWEEPLREFRIIVRAGGDTRIP
ncbi:hypothetical protein DQ04_06601020 [Trypanosoma grayi]|uniref:hypothetical protein n=1 Tax=Trypanosoma grayi TaxID=71804 RepID=UPI0004F4B84E|nr:hypothetical protein DQ04_06601020 [Trypanosoma grayi]KEG08710.1 hypothetical protein DQ04_06601020 [Trypanosoma grayi]